MMIEPIERSGLWKGTSFEAKSVPFPGRGASMMAQLILR